MRIAYLSDLHLEFEPPNPPIEDWTRQEHDRAFIPGHPQRGPLVKSLKGADLIILAGDIDCGVGGIVYADSLSRFAECPVVYVAGNHEFYGHDMDMLRRELRCAAWETAGRVIFLDCTSVRLLVAGHAVRILGCTLWTGYGLNGCVETEMHLANAAMCDHRRISYGYGWFSPHDAQREHRRCLSWLREEIQTSETTQGLEPARLVIVSHHAPIRTDLNDPISPLAPAYMSDLEEFIQLWQPDLWLHGHTHVRHATHIGKTVVASAPRGYLGCQPEAVHYHPGFIELTSA